MYELQFYFWHISPVIFIWLNHVYVKPYIWTKKKWKTHWSLWWSGYFNFVCLFFELLEAILLCYVIKANVVIQYFTSLNVILFPLSFCVVLINRGTGLVIPHTLPDASSQGLSKKISSHMFLPVSAQTGCM